MNLHLDNISSSAEPSVTKFALVMHHHGPECLARRLVCCLQVRAHIVKYDCFYHICWTANLFAPTFKWMVHHHKLECLVQKNTLFSWSWSQCRFKTLFSFLSILYLLYHWSLGNQTRCADLLLIITKPSTTKWAYTDSSTLTYSITWHTKMVGRGCILLRKMTNLVFFVKFVQGRQLFWKPILL